MKINILLPHKDKFDKKEASSVSITVSNNMTLSKFKKDTLVFGQDVADPIYPENFFGIENPKWFFKSKNKNLADKMCQKIINTNSSEQLIEIHNRPYLINYIFSKIKVFPIILFLHNDPQTMKGSKSVFERKRILSKVKLILCVSIFIKNKFLEGIKNHNDKVFVLYNGINRKVESFPFKKNEILFVGRIVPDKGVHLFVNAISVVAKRFPDWSFFLIGSTHLGRNTLNSKFAQKIVNKFIIIGEQTNFTGFVSSNKVQKAMQSASIIVIPSIWEEPYGLVVSEAMSNGAAIITSNVGGIPEVLKNNGVLIDRIDEKKLIKEITRLVENPVLLKFYQKLAWDNFRHTSLKSSRSLDNFRKEVLFL